MGWWNTLAFNMLSALFFGSFGGLWPIWDHRALLLRELCLKALFWIFWWSLTYMGSWSTSSKGNVFWRHFHSDAIWSRNCPKSVPSLSHPCPAPVPRLSQIIILSSLFPISPRGFGPTSSTFHPVPFASLSCLCDFVNRRNYFWNNCVSWRFNSWSWSCPNLVSHAFFVEFEVNCSKFFVYDWN